jgi:hypothetical protein
MTANNTGKICIAVTLVCSVVPLHTAAQEQAKTTNKLSEMVTNGATTLNFRYRFEHVDQEGVEKKAKASTLRSRLTFRSVSYQGFSFLTEFDDVSAIGDDKYNSTTNGNSEYPVVADPEGTEVNQAWLKYTWNELGGTYGRQRIIHGNQRFVGGVAWRQNEQTFDGFRAQWGSGSALSADYAYVYNVNRIFGPDDGGQPANWGGENHLIRLDYKMGKNHKLTGFVYLLEIDERSSYSPNASVNNSSDTYGIEYQGKFGPLSASAAYATQTDAGDSSLDYDSDYYKLEGALSIVGINAKVGYEVLSGDNGVGFKTPLATLHAFQGWADKFLVTPGDGIEDAYLGISGKVGSVKLAAVYHDFQAEDSSDDFGSEIDLSATWAVNKTWGLQLKYANFSSDNSDRFSDTTKLWLSVNFKI